MAIRIEDEYTNANAADSDYPEGSFKNISAPGLLDGTPLEKAWPNDIYGFLQKLLDVAGITPSGVPDTVLASDYYDALLSVIGSQGLPSGTVQLFGQASAPTGWTKLTTWSDNAMLTINTQANGTALASGGSTNPQATHSHGVGTLQFQTAEFDYTSGGVGDFYFYNSSGTTDKVIYTTQAEAYTTTSRDVCRWGSHTVQLYTFYTKNGTGSTAVNTQPLFQEIIAATKD